MTRNAEKQGQVLGKLVEMTRESRDKRAKLEETGKSGRLASAKSHSLHLSAAAEYVSALDKAKTVLMGTQ